MGLILADDSLRLVPNHADHPETCFVGPKLIANLPWSQDVQAVAHTHPGGCEWPSRLDMAQQIATGLPWVIAPRGGRPFAWGGSSPVQPLIGRGFRFGVTDCYAAVRDGLRAEFDVALPDYAREWEFWKAGPMFETHLIQNGARVVGTHLAQAEVGDVVLFKLRSKYWNHCGLVVGPGELYHHPSAKGPNDPSMLARVETLARYERIPACVVRVI